MENTIQNAVVQRVITFIEKTGKSVNAFAKSIGVGQQTLSKQLKLDGCGVSFTTVVGILTAYPELSAEWLLRGEGEMEKGVKTTVVDEESVAHYRMLVNLLSQVIKANGIDLDKPVQIYTETRKGKKDTA